MIIFAREEKRREEKRRSIVLNPCQKEISCKTAERSSSREMMIVVFLWQ
jgi:hypothetical protein